MRHKVISLPCFHLKVAPDNQTQNKEDKLSKTDNCIYYNTKIFTSLGLQNVECGQNQSEHFPFSRVENACGWIVGFFSSLLPFFILTPVFGLKLECRWLPFFWIMCSVRLVHNLGSVFAVTHPPPKLTKKRKTSTDKRQTESQPYHKIPQKKNIVHDSEMLPRWIHSTKQQICTAAPSVNRKSSISHRQLLEKSQRNLKTRGPAPQSKVPKAM